MSGDPPPPDFPPLPSESPQTPPPPDAPLDPPPAHPPAHPAAHPPAHPPPHPLDLYSEPPPLAPPTLPGPVVRQGGNSGVILALGIASIAASVPLVCCPPLGLVGVVCGVVAVVWGHYEIRAIDRGHLSPSRRSDIRIGQICALVGIAIFLVWVAAYVYANVFMTP